MDKNEEKPPRVHRGGHNATGKKVHPEKRQMREIARAHGPECIKRLRWLMLHGESHAVQLAATNAILDRAFGRPVQPNTLDTEGNPTLVVVRTGVPRADDDVEGNRKWIVSWSNDPADDPMLNRGARPLTIEGKPPPAETKD